MKEAAAEIGIRRYGGKQIRHDHEHHQLVLPLRGALEMEIAGRSGRVTGLRAAAIHGGESHSFLGADENAFLVLDFPRLAFGGATASERHRFWQSAGETPFIDFDPEMAGHLAFLSSSVRRASLAGIRAAVAGELILDGLSRRAGLEEMPLPAPVARAVRLIETCAAAPLTITEIADAAGLSPSRLHALFRAATGVSPMRYLAAERVRRAGFLLETTDYSVSRIALEVGYGDQSAFTRAFRRETGATPREHRQKFSRQESRHKEK
jgi:AraC-like DNA-binding protein